MPRPRLVFLGTLAVGAVLFVALAFFRGTTLVSTLGVPSNGVTVALKPNNIMCQEPVVRQSDRAFDRIVVKLGTFHRAGPPVDVAIRDPRTRAPLALGTIPGGYPDVAQNPQTTVKLDHAVSAPRIAVCFQNRGQHSVAFYGAGDAATQPSSATMNGRSVGGDITLSFEGPHHSWASTLSDTVAHAALFRTPRLPGWLYLTILLLLAAGAAAAMTAAVGAALETPQD